MTPTTKFQSGQVVDILPDRDGCNYGNPQGWMVVGTTRHPYLMVVREPDHGTTIHININRLAAHGVQVLHDMDTCDIGSDVTCPDCVCCGIIQTTDCNTCGACRWVHRHDGTIYNPTTGYGGPMTTTVTVEVDCHAYPWHEADPNYPECGPGNLTRMAEQYGVLVRYLPDHDWAGWAWMYEITGPRDHIVMLLADEYCGSVPEADEMVACLLGEQP